MLSSSVRSSLLAGVALLLLGVAPALADGPFRFFSLTPCRILDTRLPADAPAIPHNATRNVQVQGKCGVPVGAKAAAMNVTIVQPTASIGFLTMFPSGTSLPVVSTINWVGGEPALANGAIAPLSTNAQDLSVYVFFNNGAGNSTHLVLDVTGYFATP